MRPNRAGQAGGAAAVDACRDFRGFQPDSIILTLDGEMPVGALVAGSRAITRDSGMAIVTSVIARRVTTRAVRFAAGALGHARPMRDVLLPAGQPLLIRDWRARAMFGARQAMVPARNLVDGEFVTDEGACRMTLVEVLLARAHLLYVDGLEVAGDGRTGARAIAGESAA